MKIFVTKEIPQKGIDILLKAGHELTINPEENTPISQDSLIENCKHHDALIVSGFAKLDKNFFKACGHLKAIALFSVGYDSVDLQAATKAGIPVSNTPDVLSKATADTAFLLMLATSRLAFHNYLRILNGQWKQFEPTAFLGQDLHKKTLGIYGLGKIGLEMARKAKAAYKMKIIYHNRNKNPQAEKELNATYVSFNDLLTQSDVISVHANLSKETAGVFDKKAFSKMKSNAIFVNTARGGIHNEGDLYQALSKRTIWGAGLDVTNPEPMDNDNPMLFLPTVCVLPHIGSATQETRNGMASLVAKNMIAAANGQKLPTIINKEVYEKSNRQKQQQKPGSKSKKVTNLS